MTTSPPINKKEMQAFLDATGFWKMHIPEYIQIASPLYLDRTRSEEHALLCSWEPWPVLESGRRCLARLGVDHWDIWSRSYRESEANYTPTVKEILAAYEKVQATSEVIGTEAQRLLAPRLSVLVWMFKAKFPSTHRYHMEQMDCPHHTTPQTSQGKRYVLTMVEVTLGWLDTYPVPHVTTCNTILGLEKQVLWRHGTPEN
ncbi:hypothetical protein TURU_060696 [Turdus rufiventris]|nr:hypothetical protein TURU_060696 [Turdus rufiventris]